MNKTRRAEISAIIDQLIAIPDLAEIASAVRELADAEQDAFYAMPESLQGSDRGQKVEAAAEALSEAADALEGFDLSEVIGQLEQATR